MDENYVDENGQVVMQNNGGTDSPQPADGTQNADNPQAADGAQNADNSQAAATAQNPIPHRKHPIPQGRHLSQLRSP